MAALTETGSLITRVPGVCGARPCIAGTRMPVRSIAIWHNMGNSPNEIARQVGYLSLAQIDSALAWYFANKTEVDQEIEDEDREATRLAALHRR